MYAKASGLWSLDNMQKQIAKAATQDVHKTSQAQAAMALDRQWQQPLSVKHISLIQRNTDREAREIGNQYPAAPD